jgi:hypothetical protein
MKNLFYRLASSRSLAKIFSMDAQIEERKRVIFPKRLFFAVLGLAAFASLGAFLLPQVAQAQCFDGACDLGSDPSLIPWGNSPQSQLDIGYCIDQGCAFQELGSGIPSSNTSVQWEASPTINICTNGGNRDVTISGSVVAWLKDANGAVIPGSPANASLHVNIKCAIVDIQGTITRAVVAKELGTDVFDAFSRITIFPVSPNSPKPPSGWFGCPGVDNKGTLQVNPPTPCAFPLGIVQFNNVNAIANALPAAAPFLQGEVLRAEPSTTFAGVRDCKGAPAAPALINANTIQCSVGQGPTLSSVGGGQALGLVSLVGNWSGATAHTFNPKSGSNPYDIDISTLPPDFSIDPSSVLASADGGRPEPPTGCNAMPSQNVERCFFNARGLNVVCTTGDPVTLLVTGEATDGLGGVRKFESTDPLLTCSNK